MWFLGIVIDVRVVIPCKDMIFSLKLQQKRDFFVYLQPKETRAQIKNPRQTHPKITIVYETMD